MKKISTIDAQVATLLIFSLGTSVYAQSELLLSGPAESVNRATNTIKVVGHQIAVRDTSTMLPGHRVNVFGTLRIDGTIGARIVQDTNVFANGSDQVLISGKVVASDNLRGRVAVDGANVDYTSLLANGAFRVPAVGEVIRVRGTQPAAGGVVLATEIVYSAELAKVLTSGGQAVGVTSGGQALGVTSGGQAVGVTSGGQALGVTSGGKAVGVTSGGRAT